MKWRLKKFDELDRYEVYEILKLRSEVFVLEQNCAYLDPDGKDKVAFHLYLEDEGNIIAYSRIFEKGLALDEIAIGRVLVRKDYRNKGIAIELIARALKFIKEDLKGSVVKIQAQAYLTNFYGTFGFKAISEEYLDDGIPHVDMLYTEG